MKYKLYQSYHDDDAPDNSVFLGVVETELPPREFLEFFYTRESFVFTEESDLELEDTPLPDELKNFDAWFSGEEYSLILVKTA